jgi:hypothetical protein
MLPSELQIVRYVEEISGIATEDFGQRVNGSYHRINIPFYKDLENKMYLLDKGVDANLDLTWRWIYGPVSHELSHKLSLMADPIPELKRELPGYHLSREGLEMAAKARILYQPPEEYSGKCTSIWVAAEAATLWTVETMASRMNEEVSKEGYRDMVVAAVHNQGYPDLMASKAYDRLALIEAFKAETAPV